MSTPGSGYPQYPQYQQWQYPPRQQYQPVPKVPAATLAGVSLWRLAIVACAFVGFGSIVAQVGLGSAMPGLSQQASLLTGIVYLGLLVYPLATRGTRHEPGTPWWRGALAVLLLLVGVTYLTLMAGELDETWAVFEHVITPLAVLVDWIAVGRNQGAARWWHPLSWIVFPLAYLGYFVAADVPLYGGFLDPDSSAFAGTVAGFLVAVLVAGYLLYGIAKLKAVIAASSTRQAAPQPYAPAPPSWPYGQQQQQTPYPQQPPYQQPPQGR